MTNVYHVTSYSLGELTEAAAGFEKACAIWKAEEDPVALIESLEALGGVFFQAGRHSDAIDACVLSPLILTPLLPFKSLRSQVHASLATGSRPR